MNGYNLIAPFYDLISRVVFGNKLKELQISHLHLLPDHSSVLILGGGTGWVLEEIDQLKKGLTITYIDLSSEMIRRSKHRKMIHNHVLFIEGTEQDIPKKHYDVLITNFYLDLFPKATLIDLVKYLSKYKIKQWIWTDFVPNKSYKWLEKLMILFFKIFTGLKNERVYNYKQIIEENTTYIETTRSSKMKGFIVSSVMENKMMQHSN